MENCVINGDKVFCSMTKQEFLDNYREIVSRIKKEVFAEKKKEQKKRWNRTAYLNRIQKEKQSSPDSEDWKHLKTTNLY